MALSVPELYLWSRRNYGQRAKNPENTIALPPLKYADYIRDTVVIDTLLAAILGALAEAIGDDEFEELCRIKENQYSDLFLDYATQYVDKCNLEYLKTIPEKRKDKLRNIAKRFIKQPVSYKKLKSEFEYSAKQQNCSMHELYDPRMEYPEEILW